MSESHLVVSDFLWSHGLQPIRLLCPWDSPGKDSGVGCHFLLQGIFPTQGSSPGLLNCRQILYCLSHQGSPTQQMTNLIYAPLKFVFYDPYDWIIFKGRLYIFKISNSYHLILCSVGLHFQVTSVLKAMLNLHLKFTIEFWKKKYDVKNEEKRKPYSITIPIEKKITLLRTPYLMVFKSKEKMQSKMTLIMASQLYLQILMACNTVQQNINILTLRLTLRVLESV